MSVGVKAKKKKLKPILKFPTDCCALAQLSMGNHHSKEDIKKALEILKKQSTAMDYLGSDKQYGQKAVFVITMPSEGTLATNLQELGFTPTFNFERRMGYPEGVLTMWCKNL